MNAATFGGDELPIKSKPCSKLRGTRSISSPFTRVVSSSVPTSPQALRTSAGRMRRHALWVALRAQRRAEWFSGQALRQRESQHVNFALLLHTAQPRGGFSHVGAAARTGAWRLPPRFRILGGG